MALVYEGSGFGPSRVEQDHQSFYTNDGMANIDGKGGRKCGVPQGDLGAGRTSH